MPNYLKIIEIIGLHHRFDIIHDFSPGVNILHGVNGTGKTTEISSDKLEEVINLYNKWDKKIKSEQVDFNVIRWICHGHIGINILLEAYCSCLLYCDKSKKDKSEIRKIKKRTIYKYFANWWASHSIQDKYLYPKEVLEKLGFNLKNMKIDA
ncbi:hypothetical protein [Calothrix sp. NIES-3974]|uniref:hypothetical protein n=1 Tax=Calothrix sp. NIES-3974 TaxID=2005462 RepID=UPI000B5F4CA6|nr:hypothetical protein [Calothrix sp. NIES-3974]BAZ05441.1 hypothetical protein NIES3974_20890 [Calothrix sp. NIES-3974]